MRTPIPRQIVPSATPAAMSPARIRREFLARLDAGAQLRPAGSTKRRPRGLLRAGYAPRYRISLFDTTFYLSNVRQNEDIRFFVGYVVQDTDARPGRVIHPRIFYKDVSLIWRSASHYVRTEQENWIGKGDVRPYVVGGEEVIASAESTTDLPLELQTAFEILMRRSKRIPRDDAAVGMVLRRAPEDRIAAYSDFTRPRQRAQADPRNLVNRGRSIARFTRHNDPTSLRFSAGYEPDFARGILEVEASRSSLYGGELKRFRILSTNRRVQYLFMAGPRHVWIIPAQATTTELSSYGVRTIDVVADDDLFVPGFEYHSSGDGDPDAALDQIPEGYAGEPSAHDPSRADASPWLDLLPVVREFRRKVLRRTGRPSPRS